MTDLEQIMRRDAPITAADMAARTITVQLCAWDEPRPVTDPWRPAYTETHARGSLVPAEPLAVFDRHLGELIGRMDPPTDAGPGPVTRLHIAHTRAGNDLLALVDADVIRAVSMEFAAQPDGEIWNADRSAVTRTRSLLTGCAFAFQPELTAPILARAQEAEPMPMTDTPPAEPTPAPEPEPAPEPAPESPDEVQAQLIAMRGELARIGGVRPTVAPGPRFGSLGAVLHRSAFLSRENPDGLELDRIGGGLPLHRAWTDVTSADVPGLIPPQQLRQIFDVIAAQQPLVDAAGSLPPPTSLTITYPKITVRPLVGPQATQKTEISSRDTQIAAATASVATYAGGEDTSVQVIQLSDPSYLEVAAQLYAEEMARATDAGAYLAYAAAVPATHKTSIGTAATAWNTKLFELAGLIAADSKRFPDRLILSTDLWVKLGGAVDSSGRPLFPNAAPSNPLGTASITSPDGDVRGLAFTVDPNFPADRGAMFNSAAFRSSLGPVQTMTVDVPRLLGRDMAVFRFAAFAAVDANGLGLFATGTAPTADEEMADTASTRKK